VIEPSDDGAGEPTDLVDQGLDGSSGGEDGGGAEVEQGFACTLYIAPAGMARKDEFSGYESVAKTNRVGLWGILWAV